MSSNIIGHLWSLKWHNPYSDPPAGRPRVLAEKFLPADDPSARTQPTDLVALSQPGDGYSLYCTAIVSDRSARALTTEQLAVARQKRLTRRSAARYPLIADQVAAEELELHPDYYQGITRTDLEAARNAALAEENAERNRLLANAGQLIIHS